MNNISDIKNRLQNIKETHPHIFCMWNTYLLKKLDSLNNLLIECDKMLQTIENDEIDDLDEESILTILFISQFLNNE